MTSEEFQLCARSIDAFFADGAMVYARPSFGTPEIANGDDVPLGAIIIDPENGVYKLEDV